MKITPPKLFSTADTIEPWASVRLSLKKHRLTKAYEHSLGHKEGNHGPHFNTKNTVNEIKIPLKIGDDAHTYFKRSK